MKLLFLDIETTGFDRQWDFIIELAGILVDTATGKEIETFHEYIKPKKPIPIHITEITGITNKQVQGCRSEEEVIKTFIDKIVNEWKPDAYVGHNLDAFDNDFLTKKAGYYFMEYPKLETIDTLKIARKLKVPTTLKTATGNPSYRQEGIAAAYGIEYDAHSAIEDVRALIKIYDLMGHKQPEKQNGIQEAISKKRKSLGF